MTTCGICILGAIPLRAEASHRSEMVSQVLFGEGFRILDSRPGWLSIRLSYDAYQGWIAANQASQLPEEIYEAWAGQPPPLSGEALSHVEHLSSGMRLTVSAGSPLHLTGPADQVPEGMRFRYHGKSILPEAQRPEQLIAHARLFMHAPYLWGGRAVFGIDCSGFVQTACRMSGIQLPRDAAIQAGKGEAVHLLQEARAGDLLFFDDEEGQIVHVGIYLGEGLLIHAFGQVRIDPVDHHGIFHRTEQKYTHRLRLIKRLY